MANREEMIAKLRRDDMIRKLRESDGVAENSQYWIDAINGQKIDAQSLKDYSDSIDPLGIGSKVGANISAGMEKASELLGFDGALKGKQGFYGARDEFNRINQEKHQEREERSPKASFAGSLTGDAMVPLAGTGMSGLKGVGTRILAGSGQAAIDAENHDRDKSDDALATAEFMGAIEAIPYIGKYGSKLVKGTGKLLGKKILGIPEAAVDEYASNPTMYNKWADDASNNAPSTGNIFNDKVTDPKTRYIRDRVRQEVEPVFHEIDNTKSALDNAKFEHKGKVESYKDELSEAKRTRKEGIDSARDEQKMASAVLGDELNAGKVLDPSVTEDVHTLFSRAKELDRKGSEYQRELLQYFDEPVYIDDVLSNFANDTKKLISSDEQGALFKILNDLEDKTDEGFTSAEMVRELKQHVQEHVDWKNIERLGYTSKGVRALLSLQGELNSKLDDLIGDESYHAFRKKYAGLLEASNQAKEAIGHDYYKGLETALSNPDKVNKIRNLENLLNESGHFKNKGESFSVLDNEKIQKYLKNKFMTNEEKLNLYNELKESQRLRDIQRSEVNPKDLESYKNMMDSKANIDGLNRSLGELKGKVGKIKENNIDASIDRYTSYAPNAKNVGVQENAFKQLGGGIVDELNKYKVNRVFDVSRPNGSRLVQLFSKLPIVPESVTRTAGAILDFSGGKIAKSLISRGDDAERYAKKFADLLHNAEKRGGYQALMATHLTLLKRDPDYAAMYQQEMLPDTPKPENLRYNKEGASVEKPRLDIVGEMKSRFGDDPMGGISRP